MLPSSLARHFKAITPLDVSDTARGYVLIGNNGAAVRISHSALLLVQAVDSGVSFDALAQSTGAAGQPPLSADAVKGLHKRLVKDLKRLAKPSAPLRPPRGLCLRLAIVSAARVRAMAAAFTGLFQPRVAAAALVIIVAGLVGAWRGGPSARPSETDFLLAYGLFLINLVFHELGHASAATYCGTSPGEVGVALYLIYPVFYTDVTESWRLQRYRRALIDVSGVYFQLLTATLWVALFYATGSTVFSLAYLMNVYSAVFSLNPLLKFDGYWALADLFGIANLSRQPRRLRRAWLDRVVHGRPTVLPWSTRVTCVVALYWLASTAFWTIVLIRFGPALWHRLTGLESLSERIVTVLSYGQLPSFADLRTLIFTVLLTTASAVMLRGLVTTVQARLARIWR